MRNSESFKLKENQAMIKNTFIKPSLQDETKAMVFKAAISPQNVLKLLLRRLSVFLSISTT